MYVSILTTVTVGLRGYRGSSDSHVSSSSVVVAAAAAAIIVIVAHATLFIGGLRWDQRARRSALRPGPDRFLYLRQERTRRHQAGKGAPT